jgi:4-hydroxybenzoate polyprenyltransferase
MNWSTALTLGRVSNLPTVWTNVLAGVVLAGGTLADARLPLLLLALSLCYVAGMFLNDAFDRGFDAQHRPERPIPAGRVTAAAVFTCGFAMLALGITVLAWVGYGFAAGTQWRPVAAGLALAAAIVLYDIHHKGNPLSPVVMGLCRMLVYVTAAAAVAASLRPELLVAALLLLSYLVGLTYIAKQEHLGRVRNLWPLLFLALPLAWGLHAGRVGGFVALCAILFAGWTLFALNFLRRRRPGDVPRAVGCLLAGICLWDALVIAANGQTAIALLAAGLFALTLLLQRYIAPT